MCRGRQDFTSPFTRFRRYATDPTASLNFNFFLFVTINKNK